MKIRLLASIVTGVPFLLGFFIGREAPKREADQVQVEIARQRLRTCPEETIGGGYRDGQFVYVKEWEAKQ